MPATFEPIASQTLGSDTASVTFSSIPGTYTDLILVFQGGYTNTSGGAQEFMFTINGDTGSNYSVTYLSGNGSSASSGRRSTVSSGYVTFGRSQTGQIGTVVSNFMNYANTNVFKTVLSTGLDPAAGIAKDVNLWRSTAAITSISMAAQSTFSWRSGSTFALYGIKAA